MQHSWIFGVILFIAGLPTGLSYVWTTCTGGPTNEYCMALSTGYCCSSLFPNDKCCSRKLCRHFQTSGSHYSVTSYSTCTKYTDISCCSTEQYGKYSCCNPQEYDYTSSSNSKAQAQRSAETIGATAGGLIGGIVFLVLIIVIPGVACAKCAAKRAKKRAAGTTASASNNEHVQSVDYMLFQAQKSNSKPQDAEEVYIQPYPQRNEIPDNARYW